MLYKVFFKSNDIISKIKAIPNVNPPADITMKVMTQILEEKENVPVRFFRQLFSSNYNFGFQSAITRKECAFYFLLTGFFYFIMSLIMLIGLPLPKIHTNNHWLSFQPFLGMLLSFGLAAIGIVFYKKGYSAIRFVRRGTLLFTALVILNYWIGTLYIQFQVALFFIAIFSITGVVFAFLLRMAIDHYRPANILLEVRG